MKLALLMLIAIFSLALASCQTGEPSGNITINTKQKASDIMVTMAKIAQKCWFQSGDQAFKKYRMAAELNSHSGRPRFLIVPKNNPGDLPLLVVQAEMRGDEASGKFSTIQSFGPLLQTNHGTRIAGDIKRWSQGNLSCKDV